MAEFRIEDLSAEQLVYMARKAETSERYEDMCKFMRQLVLKNAAASDLNVEERNLLSVAYKNVIGARRGTWRTLNETLLQEGAKDSADSRENSRLLSIYKGQIERELKAICGEVLSLLTDYLLKVTKGRKDEAEVFYLKMTADYYRYLVEIDPVDENKNNAHKHYEEAMQIATAQLLPTHPIRLGLALNYSVCHYEILGQQQAACDLAKKSFDDAIAKLDTLDEASYKDSTLIMQLLRDNLTLWTQDNVDA
jgi:14-3-3 protein epsilon